MMADFRMNPAAVDALKQMALNKIVERFQTILDSVHAEFAGQPVAVIKPVLAERWAAGNEGASAGEPQLTVWATEISEGRNIVIHPGDITSS